VFRKAICYCLLETKGTLSEIRGEFERVCRIDVNGWLAMISCGDHLIRRREAGKHKLIWRATYRLAGKVVHSFLHDRKKQTPTIVAADIANEGTQETLDCSNVAFSDAVRIRGTCNANGMLETHDSCKLV
jgi:hypothetical protein